MSDLVTKNSTPFPANCTDPACPYCCRGTRHPTSNYIRCGHTDDEHGPHLLRQEVHANSTTRISTPLCLGCNDLLASGYCQPFTSDYTEARRCYSAKTRRLDQKRRAVGGGDLSLSDRQGFCS
eukprot:11740862-Heterocapsa_arctica.AAC.1